MANKTATKRRTISKKTTTKASLKTASLRNRAVAKVAKKAAKKATQRESTARRPKGSDLAMVGRGDRSRRSHRGDFGGRGG